MLKLKGWITVPALFLYELVLDRHGIRVDCFLARHAFERGEDSSVLVLVALDREAALLVTIRPSHADVCKPFFFSVLAYTELLKRGLSAWYFSRQLDLRIDVRRVRGQTKRVAAALPAGLN